MCLNFVVILSLWNSLDQGTSSMMLYLLSCGEDIVVRVIRLGLGAVLAGTVLAGAELVNVVT